MQIKSPLWPKSVALLFLSLTASHIIAATPESETLEISARVMLDYEKFDGLHNKDIEDEALSIRRASVWVKYRISDNWKARIKIGYDERDKQLELKELQFKTSHFDFADISFGKFKEPMGLEYASSSKYLAVMERSMMTEAFVSHRNLGMQLSNEHKFDNGGSNWALGLFDNGDEGVFKTYAASGRFTFHIKNNKKANVRWLPKKSLLHFGLSSSYREEEPQDPIRINQPVELYSGDTILESNKIDAKSQRIVGLEAAFSMGSFNFQSEYMQQRVTAHPESNDEDSVYSGGYIQLSYFLTGEKLRYDDKRFKGPKLGKNSSAWQLSARISRLDARDNEKGGEAENITLGLTYYYGKKLKMMLNVSEAEISGKNAIFANEGKSLAIRGQYSF